MRVKTFYQIIFLSLALIISANGSLVAQNFLWAKGWGSTAPAGAFGVSGTDIGYSVTTDASGSVYTTGIFPFPADFDPGPGVFMLSPVGSDDAFISKLDAAGNFLWAKRMGGSFFDYAQIGDEGNSVTTDAAGNVYVTGFFSEIADFGPFNLTSLGRTDVFICKLDAAGNFLWARQFADTGVFVGNSIKVDSAGNVYVGGTCQTTGIARNGLNAPSQVLGFITKLDAAGNFLWIKQTGRVRSLYLDKQANIHITGDFEDTVDFDPGSAVHKLIAAPGYTDLFVSKLDAGGNMIWTKDMDANTRLNYSSAIAVDRDGNIYTAGRFKQTVDFDPGPGIFNLVATNPTTSGFNIFIAKLDASGNFIWAKGIGSYTNVTATNHAEGLALDNEANVYVTGGFDKTSDFDPGPKVLTVATSSDDIFILKLAADGEFVWVKQIMGPGSDIGYGIHVDCNGIYTTGMFAKNPDFDPGSGSYNLTSVGDRDVFVVKLSNERLKPVIGINGFELSVAGTFSTYQWLLDGAPISGATDSIYTVPRNGTYSVIVTTGYGCPDTAAYFVNNVAVNDIYALSTQIKVYPNPGSDIIKIQSPQKVNVVLRSVDGRFIKEELNTQYISVQGLPPGIYLLYIMDESNKLIKIEKLVKDI